MCAPQKHRFFEQNEHICRTWSSYNVQTRLHFPYFYQINVTEQHYNWQSDCFPLISFVLHIQAICLFIIDKLQSRSNRMLFSILKAIKMFFPFHAEFSQSFKVRA